MGNINEMRELRLHRDSTGKMDVQEFLTLCSARKRVPGITRQNTKSLDLKEDTFKTVLLSDKL